MGGVPIIVSQHLLYDGIDSAAEGAIWTVDIGYIWSVGRSGRTEAHSRSCHPLNPCLKWRLEAGRTWLDRFGYCCSSFLRLHHS